MIAEQAAVHSGIETMRAFLLALPLAFSASAFAAEPDFDRVRKHFDGKTSTVEWGEVRAVDPAAELEIGDGSGHGFTLDGWRFVPGKDGVEVLSIHLYNYDPYRTKWPPDTARVLIKSARMKAADYALLLGDLAMIDAAKPKANAKIESFSSSNDFFVQARSVAGEKTIFDLAWAGYQSGKSEVASAKSKAAVAAAQAAVDPLVFFEHAPTDKERSWASAKFVRDRKAFEKLDYPYWVEERSIIAVGVAGDASALPALRAIMEGDPKKRPVYQAINAITRILKKDVREKPVENMDVEKTRKKVLELLKDIG